MVTMMIIKYLVLTTVLMFQCRVYGMYLYEDNLDNTGTEFVLMFLENSREGIPFHLHLTTPLHGPVLVNIRTPLLSSIDITVQVFGQNETVVSLPETLENTGTSKNEKSILVTSDDAIVVFASNLQYRTSDSIIVYPTKCLGNEYVTVSRQSQSTSPSHSYLSLMGVAAVDASFVTFYLPANLTVTFDGNDYNDEFHIEMAKYETFQIRTTDVTGTVIKSNSTIAAFSGHKYLKVEANSADHIEVMLPPVKSLSNRYLVASKPCYENPEYVRVVSTSPGTNITVNNGNDTMGFFTENAGSFIEFKLSTKEGAEVIADKAILVAQISPSRAVDGHKGDPSMSIAFSVDNFLPEYTFTVPATNESDLQQYNLVIISANNMTQNIMLDGIYLNKSFTWFNITSSYFIYTEVVDINFGRHVLSSDDNQSANFGGVIHGFGVGEQIQTVIGRYLGQPRDQINITKDMFAGSTEPYRHFHVIRRIEDYVPLEEPFHNVTTMSKLRCTLLCLDYAACYLYASRSSPEGVACLLYTVWAAKFPLQSAQGYSLYRRFN